MSNVQLVRDQSICTRKERRYKTNSDCSLRCEVALKEDGLRRGNVLDLSTTGLRMVCNGSFESGSSFTVELTTDRSHGMYRGVVRRVDPWVGGKTVIGCSLTDAIPEHVLEDLANANVVDRRSDERIEMVRKVKVSWQLQQGEVESELHDCSNGGMKLMATNPIPHDSRLRVRVQHTDGDWIEVEGNSVWHQECEDRLHMGVAFTQKDAPALIASLLENGETTSITTKALPPPMMRPVGYLAYAAIVTYTILVLV